MSWGTDITTIYVNHAKQNDIHLLGLNQSGMYISETIAKEKWGKFGFPPQAFIWKSIVTVWENKMLNYGRRKFQGWQRHCNGFIFVKVKENLIESSTSLIWVPVNRNKEERNIPLALKYWGKKKNYLSQKWDTLNTAIYLPIDMPF